MPHSTERSIYFHSILAETLALRVIKFKCRHIFSMILKPGRKLNLSLCLIKNHDMKTKGEAETQLDVFWSSAVDGGEWIESFISLIQVIQDYFKTVNVFFLFSNWQNLLMFL
jgi:hypothetical protein